MEQLYLIETYIDKIELKNRTKEQRLEEKQVYVTVQFGNIFEYKMKQQQFEEEIKEEPQSEDKIKEEEAEGVADEVIIFRVGKSFLFCSYADSLIQNLQRFPLEFALWNSSKLENKVFIGLAQVLWDAQFCDLVKMSGNFCNNIHPIILKEKVPITDECCCMQIGAISLFVRLSPLGKSVITGFEQEPDDTQSFIFQTNKTPIHYTSSKYKDDPPCYECTMGECCDRIECCYEMGCCKPPFEKRKARICSSMKEKFGDRKCITYDCGDEFKHVKHHKPKDPQLIKMKDIKGPCGNTNCLVAQRIKLYLKTTDAYKTKASKEGNKSESGPVRKKVCGHCDCEENNNPKYHRKGCPQRDMDKIVELKNNFTICGGCGGVSLSGVTCKDINCQDEVKPSVCKIPPSDIKSLGSVPSTTVCDPPIELITCGGTDCRCKEEAINSKTRATHKPYCPSYKHKHTCPVTIMMRETDATEEEKNLSMTELEDVAHNPYGLPPIKLEPCPVLGRPCSVPDGFAKLYKPKIQTTEPPVEIDPAKIRCSKEYERLKRFLADYMKDHEPPIVLCTDKSRQSIPTCCDRISDPPGDLDGKGCCGVHKLKMFKR